MRKSQTLLTVSLAALAAGIGLILARALLTPAAKPPPTVTVTIGQTTVAAEIAVTPEQHRRGLSGRKHLAVSAGMLFLFPAPLRPTFWMRGMNFGLDLIWIADGRVAEITPEVPPATTEPLPVYQPAIPVIAVLEVPAGFSRKNHLKPGDQARWIGYPGP